MAMSLTLLLGNIMLIKSLYGFKFDVAESAAKYYEKQLKKSIATLGDKYRLANPMRKGEHRNGTT